MLAAVGVIGQNIVRLREAAGYKTQRAFARALGVDYFRPTCRFMLASHVCA